MNNPRTLLIASGILLACFSLTSQAHPGGGGGVGGANVGGSSSSHISPEGAQNTNGPTSVDRDTGLDRSEDRMNQEGLTHEKATSTIDSKNVKIRTHHRQQATHTDTDKSE